MASTEDVASLATLISREPYGIAKHTPEKWARQAECFENVAQKVERDGGAAIHTWMFQLKISEMGEYLIAVHHAVWQSQTGHLFDVTPYHENRQLHPLSTNGGTLIVVDSKSPPIRTETILFGPRPSKFFAIGKSAELGDYMATLQREEDERCKELYQMFS